MSFYQRIIHTTWIIATLSWHNWFNSIQFSSIKSLCKTCINKLPGHKNPSQQIIYQLCRNEKNTQKQQRTRRRKEKKNEGKEEGRNEKQSPAYERCNVTIITSIVSVHTEYDTYTIKSWKYFAVDFKLSTHAKHGFELTLSGLKYSTKEELIAIKSTWFYLLLTGKGRMCHVCFIF